MTIDLIKQFEDVPAAYPDVPDDLTDAAGELVPAIVWQRIEAYTAHRFTPREVVWTLIADAGDQFHPPLTPVVSSVAHIWRNEAWEAVTLLNGPLGLSLPCDGTYRITAQVGGGAMPAAVAEAFKRLAKYMADDGGQAGATNEKTVIGPINLEVSRNLNWAARAIQLSGAADLLRPYRRA